MKKAATFFTYVFDYFVITFLLLLSIFLVFPFTVMYSLVISYFHTPRDSRKLSNMWRNFKDSWQNYLLFGFVTTIMLGVPILNIRVLTLPEGALAQVILFISWTVLFIGILFFIFAPYIIHRMNVTFRELMYNCIIFAIRGGLSSLIMVAILGMSFVLSLFYPLMLIPALYFLALLNYHVQHSISIKFEKEMENAKEN